MNERKLEENFERILRKLESVSKDISKLIPKVYVRKTSTFGNSSHVVLSKEHIDKKVGVIVFDDSKS